LTQKRTIIYVIACSRWYNARGDSATPVYMSLLTSGADQNWTAEPNGFMPVAVLYME